MHALISRVFIKISIFLAVSLPITLLLFNSLRIAVPAESAYPSIVQFTRDSCVISLNFSNYVQLLYDKIYIYGLITSMFFALICVAITVPLGFIMAVSILHLAHKLKSYAIILLMVTYALPFTVKLYSWMNIVDLFARSIDSAVLSFVAAVCFCSSINLPIVVYTIYNNLQKIDPDIFNAGFDLGAKPRTILLKIILPISKQTLISNSILVFLVAFGEFIAHDILSSGSYITIGQLANTSCFAFHNPPMSFAISLLMISICLFGVFWRKRG